jgi:carbamoyl-phosphate synthase large subunit
MPKRTDLEKIMIIGAGPIVIGQACEFDYSGSQACKALRQEGYKIILVNSNPATIMTDPDIADITYIEPITDEVLEEIIKKEKPDAILPTMGGQTGLNAAMSLDQNGILKKYNVELIGANAEAIDNAENRQKFKSNMEAIGLESARSFICRNEDDAKLAFKEIGIPSIIRPSFTLGGTGGGVANTEEEFFSIIKNGLDLSPTNEVLVEESLVGWKEFEMEVVRDKKDNSIIVCSIENIDPMGIHTGDSITVAPALTLTDKEYQIMRNASIACLRKIGVETGGSNVQFAINPKDGRMIVIEMNPRVSRSSALASKATGFPIAKVAAKLAVGYTLDEIENDITKTTPASFEPTIDYIVTKIPRFAFEKFKKSKPELGTAMKSVGESMAIGRNFKESLQKALISLEVDLKGLDVLEKDLKVIKNKLQTNIPLRILYVADAFRQGMKIDEIYQLCKIDKWFLEQIKEIVETENQIKNQNDLENNEFKLLKSYGFSDEKISELTGKTNKELEQFRKDNSIHVSYKKVDTCAAEFSSETPYMYSTYDSGLMEAGECEANPSEKEKIIIIGGGPNRIGQGIEFDYCCCQASFALKEMGFETIMINCNPETVSTDYDTSDRLYFEPLVDEYVLEILKKESKKGKIKGVIVQFGGQTPIKLAKKIHENGFPILGTQLDSIDTAEDREKFNSIVNELNLKQAESGLARGKEEAKKITKNIGYPIVIRPSYVLGGRAMEIVYDDEQFESYISEAVQVSGDSPVLIDKFLNDAIEIDVDAVCDGDEVFIAGIMEHIEEAGIHSGDSACCIPPFSLKESILIQIREQTSSLAKKLKVIGLINIQFAIRNDEIFILEVNPRASRTVPYVSKALNIPIAKIASKVMAGKKLSEFRNLDKKLNIFAIKEAVFPFNKFPEVDTILGPEMKSTGEAMGIDEDFGMAFAKSQMSAGNNLPSKGSAFISVKDEDKQKVCEFAKKLSNMNFKIYGTGRTADTLNQNGINCTKINKVRQGSPHVVEYLNEKKISLVINTTSEKKSIEDSWSLRRAALNNKIPYFTTLAGAKACTQAIESLNNKPITIKRIQEL